MAEQHGMPFLRETLEFLVLAGILIPLLQRFKVNQVLGFLGAGLIPEWPDVYAIFFVTWVLIQENDADLHLFDLHHKPSFE